MSAIVDITGQRFGRLTALRLAPELNKHRKARWVCQCACGEVVEVVGQALRKGSTKSCGCLNRDKTYYPERACDACGEKYLPRAKNQVVCQRKECVRKYHREWKRAAFRPKSYPSRKCTVCHAEFAPARKTQVLCGSEECRAEHKRRLANQRTQGALQPGDTQIYCLICGDEVMAHWRTLTCAKRECILARRRMTTRKRRGSQQCRCIVCQTAFWPPNVGQHYTCSPKCQRIALLRRRRRTYEKHRERRLEEQFHRLRSDPQYAARRKQLDRESRERRAATNFFIEAEKVKKQLEQRLTTEIDK